MAKIMTNLERIRKSQGLSRIDLEKLSDVSNRTIQELEQRRNNINNTRAIILYKLATALHVNIEDLLELES